MNDPAKRRLHGVLFKYDDRQRIWVSTNAIGQEVRSGDPHDLDLFFRRFKRFCEAWDDPSEDGLSMETLDEMLGEVRNALGEGESDIIEGTEKGTMGEMEKRLRNALGEGESDE